MERSSHYKGRQSGAGGGNFKNRRPNMKSKRVIDKSRAPKSLSQIKKRLRDIRRLRSKAELTSAKIEEFDREERGLLLMISNLERVNVEKVNAKKYHAVKFYDRKKVLSQLKIVEKMMEHPEGNTKENEKIRDELLVELNYTMLYPNEFKYISLYPNQEKEKIEQIDLSAGEGKKDGFLKRNSANPGLDRIISLIQKAMAGEKLPSDIRKASDDEKNELRLKISSILGLQQNQDKDSSLDLQTKSGSASAAVAADNNPIESDEFFEV